MEKIVEKQSGDSRDVRKKVGETSNRWKVVRSQVIDKRDKEESKLRQLVQYVAVVDELDKWITVTTSTVSNLSHDSNEPDVINKQLEQNKVNIFFLLLQFHSYLFLHHSYRSGGTDYTPPPPLQFQAYQITNQQISSECFRRSRTNW